VAGRRVLPAVGAAPIRRCTGSPHEAAGRLVAHVRPPRSYYGVNLDQPDPSAEPPHVYHPWRDLATIIKTTVWLLIHAIFWTVIVAPIVLGWGIVLMSVLVRVL
jgi:hypothetical protein